MPGRRRPRETGPAGPAGRAGAAAGTAGLPRYADRPAQPARLRGARGGGDRAGTSLSRAIPGIDHFKWLNEERSRAVGDAALRRIAQVAGAVRGPDDFLARLRGEAFVSLLPGFAVDAALARRWCLREAVARLDPSDVARAAGNAWHRFGGGRCRAIPGSPDGGGRHGALPRQECRPQPGRTRRPPSLSGVPGRGPGLRGAGNPPTMCALPACSCT